MWRTYDVKVQRVQTTEDCFPLAWWVQGPNNCEVMLKFERSFERSCPEVRARLYRNSSKVRAKFSWSSREVVLKFEQVVSKMERSCVEDGAKLCQSWSEVESRLKRSWVEVRAKLCRSWSEVVSKLERIWVEVGAKLSQSSSEVFLFFFAKFALKWKHNYHACRIWSRNKMAALGYVYTLGKQTSHSPEHCMSQNATSAKFLLSLFRYLRMSSCMTWIRRCPVSSARSALKFGGKNDNNINRWNGGNSDYDTFPSHKLQTPGCIWDHCRTLYLEKSLSMALNCSSSPSFH